MPYEIAVKELSPQTTLAIRTACRKSEIGATLDRLLARLWEHLESRGVQPAGPPYTRYYDELEDSYNIEAGFPIAAPVPIGDHLAIGQLPGGRVAATTHHGPYEGLGEAYTALEAWIAAQSLTIAGSPWEVYTTDPEQTPNPADYRTEVCWPVMGP